MKKCIIWGSLWVCILAGCGGGNSGGGENPSSNPSTIALFSFDETTGSSANNSVNNYYQGTIYGASRVPGKVGNALQFGAPAARVDVPVFGSNMHFITFANDLISIEAWAKLDTIINGAYSHIVGNGYGGSESFRLQLNGSKVEFLLNDGNHYTSIVTSNQDLSINTWYHIAVTYNGTTATIYINGVQDNTNNISFHLQRVVNTIFIGSRSASGFSYDSEFKGIIDELRLYNLLLSQKDISDYYESTK